MGITLCAFCCRIMLDGALDSHGRGRCITDAAADAQMRDVGANLAAFGPTRGVAPDQDILFRDPFAAEDWDAPSSGGATSYDIGREK